MLYLDYYSATCEIYSGTYEIITVAHVISITVQHV